MTIRSRAIRSKRILPAVVAAIWLASPGLAAAQAVSPGRVVAPPARAGSAVTLRTERATLRIEFVTPAMVRVRARFEGAFRADEHVMVARTSWPAVDVRVRDTAAAIELASSRVVVRVEKTAARLTFLDAATGRAFAQEDAGADGGIAREGDVVRERMRLSATEQFYGFGERKTPEAFRNACHRFVFVEVLRKGGGEPEESETPAPKRRPKKAPAAEPAAPKFPKQFVMRALEQSADDSGWADLGTFGRYLVKLQPDFDSRLYGYRKLSDLVRARNDLFEIEERELAGSNQKEIYVRAR